MEKNERLGLMACGVMVAINLGIFAVTVVMGLLDAPSQRMPMAVWGPDTPDRAPMNAVFESQPLMTIPDDPSDLMFSQGVVEEAP